MIALRVYSYKFICSETLLRAKNSRSRPLRESCERLEASEGSVYTIKLDNVIIYVCDDCCVLKFDIP